MNDKPTSVVDRWALDKGTRNENISQCFFCKNNLTNGKCLAFPNGIPEEIKKNFFLHIESYEGDNGILFEAKDEKYRNINFEPMRKKSIEELIKKK